MGKNIHVVIVVFALVDGDGDDDYDDDHDDDNEHSETNKSFGEGSMSHHVAACYVLIILICRECNLWSFSILMLM